ncbi:MAG: hypothetical protein QGG75_13295 [Alphaproteobacteria bacterium]|jgi:hypothetical protein|nr:hypothetical protein [Alphaproteobacteria bacterium]MDP7426685.1 hypothetical protein [Alphaproteobacteria bacterium]
MAFEVRTPKGWNSRRCRFVSESYLERFLLFVAREAPKGTTGAAELEALADRFRQSDAAIKALLQDSFFRCNQARQNKEFDDKRENHLGRLVVEQVSPLFVEAGGNDPKDGGLSREILPGFFHALELAIGSGPLSDYHERCTAAFGRLREAAGDNFDWEDFFFDMEVMEVLTDLLVDFSRNFEDFERRKEWFIDLINQGMTGDDGANQKPVPDWRFGERHFIIFCAGLFRPLVEAMLVDMERERIALRFGPSEPDRIKSFLATIF